METKIPIAVGLLASWVSIAIFAMSSPASAERYVAGTVGVTFADQLTDISGTNINAGLRAPDFDLQNSISYGAKLGYYAEHSWLGVEGEVLQSTPHIKNLDDTPGVHLSLTTVGINLLARYPGRTFQPYAGAGVGAVIAHISDSTTTRSDTSVNGGWNLLAGLRAFVTPYVAVFTEYKYTGAHVILGLPGEGPEEMAATARFLAGLPVQGVKIHLLYVIRGSGLERLYESGAYQPLAEADYVRYVVDFLELLPPTVVIHRITGDPHREELAAPPWCLDKARVLRLIREEFGRRGSRQGSRWAESIPAAAAPRHLEGRP